jgi:hypothetical protein
MADLQFFNSQEHLLYLVGLGFSFIILDIYPWVTLPGCFINAMAAFILTWFTEEMVTYPAQFGKSNTLRIPMHLNKQGIEFCHIDIVSILVSMSRGRLQKTTSGNNSDSGGTQRHAKGPGAGTADGPKSPVFSVDTIRSKWHRNSRSHLSDMFALHLIIS